MGQQLPDFIGLGTQKGGTTTLYKLFDAHPEIFVPPCKEVHYFDLNYHHSLEWYQQHFNNASLDQRCGEITPFYLFHPKVSRRIQQDIPHAKLIVLLRDPVERTLSHIFHARRLGFETLDLEAALDAEPERLASGNPFSFQKHSYVARSCYLQQLKRYESMFSANQMIILKSEDLFFNTQTVLSQLSEFLGISYSLFPHQSIRANVGLEESQTVSKQIRNQLKEVFSPTVAALKKCYGISWDWF